MLLLGWHVCRMKFARMRFLFFELRNFPKRLWIIARLYFVGPKKSHNIPTKFPCKKSRKICRRASAGAQADNFGADGNSLSFLFFWYFFVSQRALRDRLMSRGKNCLPTVSRQFLTRNHPRPNCLLKCLPNCLSPTREGFLSSFKINPAVRVIARRVREKNCLAANFCPATSICLFWPTGFFPCQELLVFLSVFPFFSREFRGSVEIKYPCFFFVVFLAFSRVHAKGVVLSETACFCLLSTF